MKHVLTATLVACAVAVGFAAQAPSSSKSAKPMRTARTVTLTGCLRQNDGTFTLANAQWDRGGSRTSATTGETPATGTGSSTGSSKDARRGTTMGSDTVQLTASNDVDLKSHVGHKIQVTGTLGTAAAATGRTPGDANAPTTTPPSSANPTTASQPDTNPSTQSSIGQTRTKKGNRTSGAASGGGPRTVTVTSVKMISDSCGN